MIPLSNDDPDRPHLVSASNETSVTVDISSSIRASRFGVSPIVLYLKIQSVLVCVCGRRVNSINQRHIIEAGRLMD